MTGFLLDLCFAVYAGFLAGGCPAEAGPYALYRGSPTDAAMEIYVATFDAAGLEPGGNAINCATAASLFQGQPGVTIRYWCEAL